MQPTPLRPALGIALKLAATVAFTAMSAIIKLVSDRYPIGEIIFARSFFAFVPLLAWLAWRGELRTASRTQYPAAHLRRSLAGVAGMWLGFTGLSYLPLPDATAISFTTPLVTVLLAAALLGERVRIYRLTAVAVGFAGVLVMLSPHFEGAGDWRDGSSRGALAALGAAICTAFALVEIRRMAASETAASIVFYFCVACSAGGLVTAPLGFIPAFAGDGWAWRVPGAADAGLLVGLGLIGGVGQILMTMSYRYAEASTIAPFDYTAMIWAVAFGYALFGEVPVSAVLAGAVVVMASGAFVAWRERRLGIVRAAAERASPPRTP